MSASVNNGIDLGPVTVLVRETARSRTTYEVVRDLTASLLVLDDVETVDWLVSVHAKDSGEVVASRRFDSRRRAERARANLVTVAETTDDPDGVGWNAALARA